MLKANGIDAVLLGEYQQGGIGELMPADFASVKVPGEQLESASVLIEEYANSVIKKEHVNRSKTPVFTVFLVILTLSVSIYLYFTLFLS